MRDGEPARRGPLRLGILASGEGSLFEAVIIEAERRGTPLAIVVVLADRAEAAARERARRLGVPERYVDRPTSDPVGWSERVDAELTAATAEVALLDGFRSTVPPPLVRAWGGRLWNVHPSLLPRHGGPGFFGARVHEAVLAAHDTETGATVHEVTDAVDAGRILAQRRLPVLPGDSPASLRERLRPVEVAAVLDALAPWLSGRPG